MPAFANPADYFMKLLSVNYPIQSEDKKKLDDLNQWYRALLQKQIIAENNIIRLDAPKQTGNQEARRAPTKV